MRSRVCSCEVIFQYYLLSDFQRSIHYTPISYTSSSIALATLQLQGLQLQLAKLLCPFDRLCLKSNSYMVLSVRDISSLLNSNLQSLHKTFLESLEWSQYTLVLRTTEISKKLVADQYHGLGIGQVTDSVGTNTV